MKYLNSRTFLGVFGGIFCIFSQPVLMCYLAALAAEDPVVFAAGLVPADAALVFSPGQGVGGRVGFW